MRFGLFSYFMRLLLSLLFFLAPVEMGAAFEAKSVRMIVGPVLAHVVRVRDGDSVDVMAQVWPGTQISVSVRLAGIDAPELRARCGREKRMALAARDRLVVLLSDGPVHLEAVRGGKYFGRVLARVLVDGRDVQDVLLREKLVRRYKGGKRAGWCESDQIAGG